MMKKTLLFLCAFSFFMAEAFSQEIVMESDEVASVDGPSVTFKTDKLNESTLTFYVQTKEHNAWADLNGNKKLDAGEYLDDSDPEASVSVTLLTDKPTITLYGEFTELDLRSLEITSISFKDQRELFDLRVMSNKLSGTVDFSNMPALKELWFNFNQLSSFTVDNCPKLQNLVAFNNSLTDFRLTETPNLKKILAFNNRLEELKLSDLKYLQLLDCKMNSLSSVHLKNMLSLKGIDVQKNAISEVTIDNCPLLDVIMIQLNHLKGVSMKNFVAALPDRTDMKEGNIAIIDAERKDNETNVCLTTDVKAAKEKNWNMKYSDGTDYDGKIPESIEDVDLGKIKVLFNRDNDCVLISGTEDIDGQMATVYNQIGQIVSRTVLNAHVTTVDMSNCQPGLYIISILNRPFKVVK